MIKYKDLKGEKEVEHFWWEFMKHYFPKCSVYARETGKNTDGLLIDEVNKIYTLIEVKEELDLKKPSEQAKVLIQSIFYIKQYEIAGKELPKTVFIADKNEAFIIHTNSLLKYLDYDIDWSIAPSQAYKKITEMLIDITEDEKINPFVFSLKDGFNFDAIKLKLIDLNQNVKRLIKISDNNIQQVFEYFIKNILNKNILTINEQVNLFIDLLINPLDNYLHPKKRNILLSKSLGFVNVNEKKFISFFEHYDGEQYTIIEKERMVSIIDRLIEDESRRKNGEFFTPSPFAKHAHKYISKYLCDDWEDKYIVWDCCSGTGNLTRNSNFKNLYQSTLHNSDIETMKQMKINPESTKFQFDFLNDDLELLKEPDYAPELYQALQDGKEIIFLINPPYIKATPIKGQDGTGISSTMIGNEMKNKKLGISSSQLSTQFMYNIIKIKDKYKNVKIAIFNKPNYMTSDGFKDFRQLLLNDFGFRGGFLFNASHFSDTANSWGVAFSMWDSAPNNIKNNFVHKIIDFDYDDCVVIEEENKTLYNCDVSKKSNIIFNDNDKNDIYLPPIKSFITVEGVKEKKGCSSAIGYINNHSNNLMQQNVVFLASSVISANGNKPITKNNFNDVISLFSVRKIVKQNWINDKDEYLYPNVTHEKYKQFEIDSIVYSIFNNSSQQSSLRKINYKDKLWDIKNEFFWLSKQDMMTCSEEHYFDDLYQDARNSDDRFVYNKLFNDGVYNDLSPLAKEVLDMATTLLKQSFKMRKFMSDEYPDYHLNCWDAGYAQLKLVWKEYFIEDFKLFRNKYNELEKFMKPIVFELGYLKY